MRIVFEMILVLGLCGTFVDQFTLALPMALHQVVARHLDEDPSYPIIKISGEIKNKKNNIMKEYTDPKTIRSLQKPNKLTYLLYANISRDKRYTDPISASGKRYRELCHLKICNFLKPRRRSTTEDNETVVL